MKTKLLICLEDKKLEGVVGGEGVNPILPNDKDFPGTAKAADVLRGLILTVPNFPINVPPKVA